MAHEVAVAFAGGGAALAQAQSVDPTAMDQLNMANPEPAQVLVPAGAPKKEPFFDDTKADLRPGDLPKPG